MAQNKLKHSLHFARKTMLITTGGILLVFVFIGIAGILLQQSNANLQIENPFAQQTVKNSWENNPNLIEYNNLGKKYSIPGEFIQDYIDPRDPLYNRAVRYRKAINTQDYQYLEIATDTTARNADLRLYLNQYLINNKEQISRRITSNQLKESDTRLPIMYLSTMPRQIHLRSIVRGTDELIHLHIYQDIRTENPTEDQLLEVISLEQNVINSFDKI